VPGGAVLRLMVRSNFPRWIQTDRSMGWVRSPPRSSAFSSFAKSAAADRGNNRVRCGGVDAESALGVWRMQIWSRWWFDPGFWPCTPVLEPDAGAATLWPMPVSESDHDSGADCGRSCDEGRGEPPRWHGHYRAEWPNKRHSGRPDRSPEPAARSRQLGHYFDGGWLWWRSNVSIKTMCPPQFGHGCRASWIPNPGA